MSNCDKQTFNDNSHSIGCTPLVKLSRVVDPAAQVYAKLESRNPAGSVKCRIGANMIWDAEQRGELKPGMTILEPTSGNTGIALAFVAASRHYKLLVTMPETASMERRKLLEGFGAEYILTPGEESVRGAIAKANEIYATDPEKYFMPKQFDNPANPEIHEKTTGPEIWNDTQGQVDVLIAGVGTGGTITGTTRYLRKLNPNLISVAVEPMESPAITRTLNGEEIQPAPHKIQGIGAGFIPKILDLSLINEVCQVNSEEAFAAAKEIMHQEGILAGISSGASLAAVRKCLEKHPEWREKRIVAIFPDSGERYLSTPLYEINN